MQREREHSYTGPLGGKKSERARRGASYGSPRNFMGTVIWRGREGREARNGRESGPKRERERETVPARRERREEWAG